MPISLPRISPHRALAAARPGRGRRTGSRRRRCGRRSGSRPMIDRPVIVLPQPDSPTRPTVSPGSTAKLTPSTARTTPERSLMNVRRPSISSTPRSPRCSGHTPSRGIRRATSWRRPGHRLRRRRSTFVTWKVVAVADIVLAVRTVTCHSPRPTENSRSHSTVADSGAPSTMRNTSRSRSRYSSPSPSQPVAAVTC